MVRGARAHRQGHRPADRIKFDGIEAAHRGYSARVGTAINLA